MSPTPYRHPSSLGADPPLPVLILDDERFDRHRLARMCSSLNFPCEITTAKTLADFSDSLEQQIFGLILIDYVLPDGTGLEALDMVRLCARNLNAPTLMISGQDEKGLPARALSAGCSDYLSKDALTKTLFNQAVTSALGNLGPPMPTTKATFNRDELNLLLSHVSQRNARDIKPMVSRMMRQLRGLRTGNTDDICLVHAAIEQNCMSLWAFLTEIERQDGADLVHDLLAHHAPPEAVQPQIRVSRKPPSPFSKLRH